MTTGILFRMKPDQGTHYIGRRALRPGDKVRCDPDVLGGAVDKFVRLEPDLPRPAPKTGLIVRDREGGGFDVINEATGRPINAASLSGADAKALVSVPIATDRLESDAKAEADEKKEEDKKGDR